MTESIQNINLDTLRRNCDGEIAFMIEMVAQFQKLAPDMLSAVVVAAKKGSASELEFAAHSFKGAAGVMGADIVADAAAILEAIGNSGDMNGVPDIISAFEEDVKKTIKEFEILKNSLLGPN